MADNRIALLAQAPVFDTPFESQGKALQLRQLMNQGQVDDLEMQQKRQAMADDAATRNVFSTISDPTERIAALYKVSPKAALSLQKSQQDLEKSTADIAESKAKTQETIGKAINQKMTQRKDLLNTVNDPQSAAQWVQGMFADPDLGSVFAHGGDTVEKAIKRIPTDPKKFAEWKAQSQLGADKLIQLTTPDANARLSAQTSRANNAATIAQSERASLRTDARMKALTSPDGMLPDETVALMAQQYMAGDTSVMQNLGRGAQGAQNIIKLRNEIARQTTGQGRGGADLAAQNAEYFGTKAGQRTAGTRIANVEMAANEAESLIPLAREASAAVARSGLLPFGKAQVMFDNQTNDPALRQFAAANNALVNVYSRAISPSGVPTVADKEHAREMISTAMNDKSYQAVLNQMQKEITAARSAPQAVRKAFNAAVTGKGGHDTTPTKTTSGATVSNW